MILTKTHPITFRCITCEDINKSRLGEEVFEPLDSNFDSFTDAFEHLLVNRVTDRNNHYIVAESVVMDA